MGLATPHHTTPKNCDNGTVTTLDDTTPDPGDHGGETGDNPPPR